MAGLLARLALAHKAVDALEANVLSRLPAYAPVKTQAQSMLSPEDIEGMSVVIMRFGGSWQIGFEIERIEGGCPWRPSPLWRDGLAEGRCAIAAAQPSPRPRPETISRALARAGD